MEESIEYLSRQFELPELELQQYSPLTLAYIGDAAYELIIRTVLVRRGNAPVNKLHRRASSLVKAEKQSSMVRVLEPKFTEEKRKKSISADATPSRRRPRKMPASGITAGLRDLKR